MARHSLGTMHRRGCCRSRRFFVTVSPDGEVFATNTVDRCVCVFSLNGALLRQWGSRGNATGQFQCPCGIAVTRGGEVLVADRDNHRVQVFRTDGTFVRAFGIKDVDNGGRKFYPRAVAVTQEGDVAVVAEVVNCHIHVFRIGDGAHLGWWGQPGLADGEFLCPVSLCITSGGEVSPAPPG